VLAPIFSVFFEGVIESGGLCPARKQDNYIFSESRRTNEDPRSDRPFVLGVEGTPQLRSRFNQ